LLKPTAADVIGSAGELEELYEGHDRQVEYIGLWMLPSTNNMSRRSNARPQAKRFNALCMFS
jgi:hypothetical protein